MIFTDRELACIYAITEVFPNAKNLLCRRHISVDVRKYVMRFVSKSTGGDKVKTKKWADLFSKRWNALVRMPTVEAYEEAVAKLDEEWYGFKDILEYVHRTWLTPYRERFVSAWTDDSMHFGNTTTNR